MPATNQNISAPALRALSVMLLLWLSMAAAFAVPVGDDGEDVNTQLGYTTEHPLVYEDCWTKWPYSFINDKGEPDGYNIDLVREVMVRLNVPYTIVLREQNEVHANLASGKADLSFGVSADYNASFGRFGRETVALFTNSLLVRGKAVGGHVSVDNLKHRHIYLKKDSRALHCLIDSGLPDSCYSVVRDMDVTIHVLTSDGKDGVVWNSMMLNWHLKKYGLTDEYSAVPVDIPPGEYRAMGHDSLLLASFDSVVSVMRAEGELASIERKWLYPEMVVPTPIPWPLIITVTSLLLAVLTGYLLVSKYNRSYEHRTMESVRLQMKTILKANDMHVWIYLPVSHRYAWMSLDGKVTEEYNSFDFSQFFPNDGFSIINADVLEILGQNTDAPIKETMSCRFNKSTGRVSDIEMTIQGLRDSHGKIYLVCGVVRDISDTKSSSDKLQLQCDCLSVTFNMMEASVIRYDSNGHAIEFNERCWGRDNEHIRHSILRKMDRMEHNIFITDYDRNHAPDDLHYCASFNRRDALRFFDKYLEMHEVARGEDGVSIDEQLISSIIGYYDIRVLRIRNAISRIQGYLVFVKDVTQEAEAGRLLRERREGVAHSEYYNELLVNSRDFAIEKTGTWMIEYHPDQRLMTMRNNARERERTLTYLDMLRYLAPEESDKVVSTLLRMNRHRHEVIVLECKTRIRLRGTHDFMHIRTVFHPIYDKKAEVRSYMGTCIDTTEAVNSVRLLAEYREKTRRAEFVRQSFVRNVSHAMIQPLTTIQTDIMQLDTKPEIDASRSMVEDIRKNTRQLLKLTDDSILLSRLQAGDYKVKTETFDFIKLLYAVIEQVKEKYVPAPGLTYEVPDVYESYMIEADRWVMERIIYEILALSARHTQLGTISVKHAIRGTLLNIAVEDTSQGLPQEIVDHIFELIPAMAIKTQSNDNRRSGLELPILKALVDSIKGQIEIESTPGRGNTIWVSLPIIPKEGKLPDDATDSAAAD